MKVLVTGSRNWTDFGAIKARLAELPADTVIIEGGASGADALARTAARKLRLYAITAYADWNLHGKAAGPKRNRIMLDLQPDLVLGFRINQSPGATDCIEEAKRRGIPVEVVDR